MFRPQFISLKEIPATRFRFLRRGVDLFRRQSHNCQSAELA
jgi:hypothetical protein